MKAFTATVRADLRRCSADATSAWKIVSVIRTEMGLQAILVYRFGRALYTRRRSWLLWPLLLPGWLLYALAAESVRTCYGIRLSLTADIGAGFWIGHFGGIEIANCSIGERCSIGQQTKIGHRAEPAGPSIGDGVWIGAHARIFGPTRVGEGSTIAPGTRVVKNVPSRALVVGDPGRVVFRGYDNSAIVAGQDSPTSSG